MKLTGGQIQADNWKIFISEGDLDALSRVYFFYYDFLFDYGLRLTTDKQAVEDAIQNEFLNIIKSRKGIGNVRNLPGYLISSFRRQLLLDLKKQERTILAGENQEYDDFMYFRTSDPEGIGEKERLEQLFAVVRQCVGQLTNHQQEILFLRFEKNISYEEISQMLNISIDSCYKLLYRSIKTIRAETEKIVGERAGFCFWYILQAANYNKLPGNSIRQQSLPFFTAPGADVM